MRAEYPDRAALVSEMSDEAEATERKVEDFYRKAAVRSFGAASRKFLGKVVSMAFTEAASDYGALSGRGSPLGVALPRA